MLINTIIEGLEDEIICGDIDNDGMIKIIELCAMYLNLKKIPKYAKDE